MSLDLKGVECSKGILYTVRNYMCKLNTVVTNR